MIKLVAVDMDGTFLDDQKKYDKKRFLGIFERMRESGAEFVVASGNQHVQLAPFFEEIKEEITFVSDNGAYVCKGEEDIFAGVFEKEDFAEITKILRENTEFETVVCGKKGAYVLRTVSDEFCDSIAMYCPVLIKVKDFAEIDDIIFKFALSCKEEETYRLLDELSGAISHMATPVSSGHGSIDLIKPGNHKGHAIKLLMEKWGIQADEVMTFGDGGNDLEMLKLAGFGFAMENAPDYVKKAARFVAKSNNESGVLVELEKHF
ncbi:cof family hydrolase [Listeria fleischmannii 1991]|uniref:Phosphatase YbjI n=3 Tax=Listeria fleischmannii TaxID=1069827 RepID=A0A2X3GLX2_9LIST|nr:Cof-type HAD-IIB family hydrolase [Listeria fleischmannii]EMG28128.1 cof family hydrolase [Listeria fleischmannii subsp. fleischmannii LU2006-1]KMT58431.1 cof family hydrolase [Listeria fleischmannii 1991]SQC69278.1 Phosphatase YbjI [Listeria fleischmannii subsp. fleischmannii]